MNVWGKCTHLITTMVKLRLFFSHQPLPPCGGAHLRRTSALSKHTITITLHNLNSPVTRKRDLCPPKNQTLPFILLHHPQQPNRQPANHQVARARIPGRLLGRLHPHRHQGDTRRQYHQCVALGCRQRPDTLADSPLSLSRVKFCCAWPVVHTNPLAECVSPVTCMTSHYPCLPRVATCQRTDVPKWEYRASWTYKPLP